MMSERLEKVKFAKDCNPDDKVIVITQQQYNLMIKLKDDRKIEITAEITKLEEEKTKLNTITDISK